MTANPPAVSAAQAPATTRRAQRWWRMGVVAAALLMSLPTLVVAGHLLLPSGAVWAHLADTVLADYVSNSLILMLLVAAGTLLLGVSAAWLTAMCAFPGRGVFEWALLLPLAMPAYIIAYTYTGMLEFSGPLQTAIRDLTGWGYGDYWFPEIRSLGGAGLMLTLVLYPYVYLLTRAAFLNQSLCVLDVSRTLGESPWGAFRRVALPLARPAIIAGLSLALMETLADYGTVQYFGVSTFTTGIFRTWYGLDNAPAAAQLAGVLLLFVFSLILLERYGRRQAKYHHTSQRHQAIRRFVLSGWRRHGATLLCALMLLLGFLLPAGQLALWAVTIAEEGFGGAFAQLAGNTLMLAALASALALLLALFLGYGARIAPSRVTTAATRVAGLGYAVPGTVIAVGVAMPFAALDNTVDAWARAHLGFSTGLILSGTLAAVTFAYLARFLAVSLQTVESGLGRIKPSMDEAAKSLGAGGWRILGRIHLPMLRGALLTALLLVFVDVLKELPATLILRPFNFNTLAVRAYELASDERLADAAPASLAIVAVGVLPVILLSRAITASRQTQE
ncbi:ABC transporter permease [Magnetofaba australis]